MTNRIIGTSEAARRVAKIGRAISQLNAAVHTAAVRGVDVELKDKRVYSDHYTYRSISISSSSIDLAWEPPGTYAEEEAA